MPNDNLAPDAVRMRMQLAVVGPWSLNAYALICPHTGSSVLIDPGAEPDILEHMLAGSQPAAILVTHSHPDHIGALGTMRKRLKVPVMAHPEACARLNLDRVLNDGERLPVGRCAVRVQYTPGHTADQLCLAIEADPRMIVGDTIFEGGPGKTLSPQAFQTTLNTLRKMVLNWPDNTICYPGHGPSFRLGDKRRPIEAFLQKDHGRFFGDATWDMGT